MKKVMALILTVVLLFAVLSQTGLASDILETIQVARNSINITVNGEKVNNDNFVFNGTTYVPLRAISEMFGFNVDWKPVTNTAEISGSLSKVASADWKTITSSRLLDPYNPQIKMQDFGINAKQVDYIVLQADNKSIPLYLNLQNNIASSENDNLRINPLKFNSPYTIKIFMQNGERYKVSIKTSGLPNIENNGEYQVIFVPAMPEKGFNYPYYLTIPSNNFKNDNVGKKRYLLVEPNNTGATNNYEETLSKTKVDAEEHNLLGEKLWLPRLIPCFPRPMFGYNNNFYYPHALDRDSVMLTDEYLDKMFKVNGFRNSMQNAGLDEKYLRDMVRIDKQLNAMIDHAVAYLNNYSQNVSTEKVFMFGFSASGSFTNRWAVLYPEKVKAVASGGLNSLPVVPVEKQDGRDLIFPLGISDYKEITGKEFDISKYKQVANYIFQGENDENDTYGFTDCFGPEENDIIKSVFGKQMYPTRWEKLKELFFNGGGSANFVVMKGLGHGWNSDMNNEIINFFNTNRESSSPVYPTPLKENIVFTDIGE